MKKIKLIIFIFLSMVVVESRAEEVSTAPVHGQPVHLYPVENTAFGPGEMQKFVLKYEFISAGEATLTVREGEPVHDRPTYFIESTARTNGFFDVFFKVRDFNASHIDKESLASVAFLQNLREGGYRVFRDTKINYQLGSFDYQRQYKGRITNRSGVVTEPASDILSAFYYVRTFPLVPGEQYSIKVFSDKAVYDLEVNVDKKIKTIKVPAGKFECISVKPKLVGDAIFKAREGKMTIWMTNDEYKMPVLLRSKVLIGSFDAELVEYTLPSK